MSNFEQRVLEVVGPKIEEQMQLFQDMDSSTRDYADEFKQILDLLKEVKTEVNKVEHNQPKQEDSDPEEKKPKKKERKKPTLDDLRKLKDLLLDDDPRNLKQLMDLVDELDPLKGWKPTLPDGTQGVPGGDPGLLPWIDFFPDGGDSLVVMKLITDTIKKLIDDDGSMSRSTLRDTKSYLDYVKKDLSGSVEQVQSTLEDCCESMSESMEEVKDRLNQLDPATASNNVLEILQRQKVIQATLDDIRGLL